jgi:hypothetical protein
VSSTIRPDEQERSSSESFEPEGSAHTSAPEQSSGGTKHSGADARNTPVEDAHSRWFVRCGWIAALISGVTTILVVIFGTNPEGRLALIDAAIFLALAWGIYRRSRVAAVLALIWWMFERIYIYKATGNPYLAFGIGPIIFTAAYVLAIVALLAAGSSASASNATRSRLG